MPSLQLFNVASNGSTAEPQHSFLTPSGSNSWLGQMQLQWQNPSDILSLLLLLGGDVVQRALAQQTGAGGYLPPPVVFSFGWLSYTFGGLLAAVGTQMLMPPPEFPCVVFSSEWGYHRLNQSWILGRLLRDFENYWMPDQVRRRMDEVLKESNRRDCGRVGLCVSIFDASAKGAAGVPVRDWCWYSGYLVALMQLAIAIIPWIIWHNWIIFAITFSGTLLAFTTASLPHWSHQRWTCRRDSSKSFVLTRGNGAQHAIVIRGNGRSLDFEALASSSEGLPMPYGLSWIYSGLTLLWCTLLMTVCGVRNQTWFLLGIGGIGMAHTVWVAGTPRRPGVYGVHLDFRKVIAKPKVMATLMSVEKAYAGLGRSMLWTFFPGALHPSEEAWWKNAWEVEQKSRSTDLPNTVGGTGGLREIDLEKSSRT